MSKQEVILCEELESSLTSAIGKCPHDKLFILTDEHTHRLCIGSWEAGPPQGAGALPFGSRIGMGHSAQQTWV